MSISIYLHLRFNRFCYLANQLQFQKRWKYDSLQELYVTPTFTQSRLPQKYAPWYYLFYFHWETNTRFKHLQTLICLVLLCTTQWRSRQLKSKSMLGLIIFFPFKEWRLINLSMVCPSVNTSTKTSQHSSRRARLGGWGGMRSWRRACVAEGGIRGFSHAQNER